MQDPRTYKRYAEECYRLAKTLPTEYRSTLLEIAEAWIKLAQESESRGPQERK